MLGWLFLWFLMYASFRMAAFMADKGNILMVKFFTFWVAPFFGLMIVLHTLQAVLKF